MSPAVYNLTIQQGTTEPVSLLIEGEDDAGNVSALNLTGHSFAFTAYSSFSGDPVLSLTTQNGGVVVESAAEGLLNLIFEDADTSGATWVSGRYELDDTFPDGQEMRLMVGAITLAPEGALP